MKYHIELANQVGIHYTQIGRYETKGAQPSAEILSKLANALEVSSDFLTNGTSDDLADSSLTDKELLNQFKQIEKMPEAKRSVVKDNSSAISLLGNKVYSVR